MRKSLDMPDERRQLPSVDQLLQQPELQALASAYSHAVVVDGVRSALDDARQGLQAGSPLPDSQSLVSSTVQAVRRRWQPTLAGVINATGVIIHTNLGRAPLSAAALRAVADVAQGYSNLEYDLDAGERGSRHAHVEHLLIHLTGAQAAMVVNNNAAAVLLALSAISKGKDVIVSRGQAVEIGGGFRIPDVMRQSGARLIDVGTTNRTNLRDYEDAISERTAALLQVHSSNFRVVGFTASVELADLCELGRRRGIPVINDLGSGSLLDSAAYGLAHEPMVQESIRAGASLTCFSGDKLLGGPQSGIIVGAESLINKLKQHPLARAVRVDKMTLGALQATLLHYVRGEAVSQIPVWVAIARPHDEIEQQAAAWVLEITAWSSALSATVVAGRSTVGGGSLPGETLPTRLVQVRAVGGNKGAQPPVLTLSRLLRSGSPPVIARIERNALLLDPRTVLPGQEMVLMSRLREAIISITA